MEMNWRNQLLLFLRSAIFPLSLSLSLLLSVCGLLIPVVDQQQILCSPSKFLPSIMLKHFKAFFVVFQMFKYKIKISDARRAWMKSPEELQNCSTGFKFPSPSDEATQVLRGPS